MKTLVEKSCSRLFMKCIIFMTIFNALIYMATFYGRDKNNTVFIVTSVVQVCFSLFLGLCIRKRNRGLLSQSKAERKRYAGITFAGFIILALPFIYTDFMPSVYLDLRYYLRERFNLNRIFTVIDFLSILVCLGAVFFYKSAQCAPINSNWGRPVKFVTGTSCKSLFVKCLLLILTLNILLSIAVTVFFYLTALSQREQLTIYLYVSVTQICLSFFLGLYIRHKNQTLFSQKTVERRHYAIITCAAFSILLIIILFPGIVAAPYSIFKTAIYKIFRITYFLTPFDLFGMIIFMCAVFLYKPVKRPA